MPTIEESGFYSTGRSNAMTMDDPNKPQRLLGSTVDPCYYDDEVALTEYVSKNFQHMMTPLELRVVLYSAPIVSNSEMEKARRIHEYCESKHGHVDDHDVLEAFKIDRDDFLLRVRQRVVHERKDEVFINRCPECSRIVRSPLARQCPWCKHDWHAA